MQLSSGGFQRSSLVAKIGVDTAENGPSNVRQVTDEIRRNILVGARAHPRRLAERRPAAPRLAGETALERQVGRSAKFQQNFARFRLYRHRFLEVNYLGSTILST